MESYLVFCLNFVIFEAFFSIVFRFDFWTHFLSKNRSKMSPKLSSAPPLFRPFSRLRFFVVFLLIVVRGDRRHLEILAVEAIIFIHETGGHWQKQVSLALKKGIPKRHAKFNAEKVIPLPGPTASLYLPLGNQNEAKMDAGIDGKTCQNH